jgi:hypothetical protein
MCKQRCPHRRLKTVLCRCPPFLLFSVQRNTRSLMRVCRDHIDSLQVSVCGQGQEFNEMLGSD